AVGESFTVEYTVSFTATGEYPNAAEVKGAGVTSETQVSADGEVSLTLTSPGSPPPPPPPTTKTPDPDPTPTPPTESYPPEKIIEDGPAILGNAPEDPSAADPEEVIDLSDDLVPLADVPQTGDTDGGLLLPLLLAALAAAGAAVVVLGDKKRGMKK
ncbi:MAG: hypothetical protein LBT12_03525, partial [Oscillospiraceae bacterium]|nr:hypothetical protein [Oscillospiraceae bacterium]